MPPTDPYEIYACPACKTKVKLEGKFLVCNTCGRRYPIDDHGVPHMLINEGDIYRRKRRQRK